MLNPFEGKTKREIMIKIGQDPGEDLRNSKHVDFNTNLFGDKSKKIIKSILDEIKSNKLEFSVVNKKENISVLIANLYRIIRLGLRDYCHAPMNPKYFKEKNIGKLTKGKIGYNGWSAAVKIFKQLDYVQVIKGKEGWLSRIKYTDKFYNNVIEKFKLNPQDILKTKPNIIKTKTIISKTPPSFNKTNNKKTKEKINIVKTEVEVKNSRRTYQVIKRVENYNKLLLDTDIVPGKMDVMAQSRTSFANRTYTRRFVKSNLKLGGRFYGPYWQTLPKKYRKLIKINGEEVVELDYNAMHLHLLYSKLNKSLYDYYPFNKDPYAIPEYNRKIVKLVFTACINENCTRKNINHVGGQQVSEGLPDLFEEGLPYREMVDSLGKNHPEVAPLFYSEIGYEISYMESRVTDYIVTVLTKHKIPVLSIHDSFVVVKSKVSFLRTIMQEAFTKLKYKSIPFIK
tara:strand:- start:25 stop:1386 length:1362 start_codon:yes stop_codon:yes gene_type:complete